jgi:site-specific recombinase XerD
MSKVIIIDQDPEPWETAVPIPGESSLIPTPPGIYRARLRELYEPYRVYLEFERGYPRSTISTYTKEVERFLNWLEENPRPIERGTFLKYREDLRGRYAPSTVNLALVGIRKFLSWLLDIGEIPSNPALGVEGIRQRGRSKAHKKDALTPGEARRLLALIPTDTAVGARDKAIIGSMLYGGLRTVEARRALLKHYRTRQDRRVLLLQGKGRSEAGEYAVIVPVLEDMIGAWLSYHPRGDDPEAPLFCSLSPRSYGRPLSSSGYRRMIKGYFREAGIREPSKSSHSLRHSAISAVIRGGGTLLQAQSFARHESPETTMIYIHESDRLENPPELLISYEVSQ